MTADEYHKMMEVKNLKEREGAELKKKERQKSKRGSRRRQKRNKRNPVKKGTKQTGEREVQANEVEDQGLSGQKE